MSSRLLSAAITILLSLGAIASGCADGSFAAPPASAPALISQLDIYQLQLDYSRDVAAADRVYLGKTFYFGAVRADYVSSIFDVRGNENYVIVNNVKFRPRASGDMKGIIQGTTFDVFGDVQGVQSGYVVVNNCWFTIQSGGASYGGGGAY